MAMRMMKKAMTVVAAAAMIVATVPTVPAYAANAIVTYDFESGTNMTSTGFGTDPTVVSDPERGNVLQFADGGASEYQSSGVEGSDEALGINNTAIVNGSPSSLSFANPFCGKSLTSAGISMWVKVPAGASVQAPGLVGFVSSPISREHPDKITYPDEPEKQKLQASTGPVALGITASSSTSMDPEVLPMINLAALQHNWFTLSDEDATLASNEGKWVFMTVSLGNAINDSCVYINGQKVNGLGQGGKRFNKGESEGGTPGNTTEPTMMEFLTMQEMATAYVGYTGFSPTVAGVCIDDLTFYDSAIDDATAQQLYASAQAGGNGGGQTPSDPSNPSNPQGGDNNNANTPGGTNTGTTTGGTKTSNKTSNKTGTGTKAATSNLPQTGVVSTGLLVAGGAAAVAAGAILFKKKENDEQ